MKELQFGVEIPTFAGGGGAHRDCPLYYKVDWNVMKETAIEAERLGYDHLLAADHLGFITPDSFIYEVWTTLTALSSVTKRVKFEPLVICNSYRSPAVLAKMGATFDVISNGRLMLGYGAGWNEKEYNAYGIPFSKPIVRIEQMKEGVTIIKKMWTESKPTFEGKHYTIREAICEPKPVQKPYPPIIIGAVQPRMLKAVAEVGDGLNIADDPTVEQYKEKWAIVEKRCRELGRNPDDLIKSLDIHVIIRRKKGEVKDFISKLNQLRAEAGTSAWETGQLISGDSLQRYIVGTPDDCAKHVQKFLDIGVTQFGLWFPDYPNMNGIRLFAEEVIPRFR